MRKLEEKEKAEINELLSEHLDIALDQITDDSMMEDDLGAYSLDQVEVIMKIEKKFNICIPDSEFEEAEKVSDLYMLVERYL